MRDRATTPKFADRLAAAAPGASRHLHPHRYGNSGHEQPGNWAAMFPTSGMGASLNYWDSVCGIGNFRFDAVAVQARGWLVRVVRIAPLAADETAIVRDNAGKAI